MLSSIEKEINEIVSEDETDDTLSSIGDCKRLSFQKIKFENTKLLSRNKNLEIEVNSLRNENENLKEKIDHYDSYFNTWVRSYFLFNFVSIQCRMASCLVATKHGSYS